MCSKSSSLTAAPVAERVETLRSLRIGLGPTERALIDSFIAAEQSAAEAAVGGPLPPAVARSVATRARARATAAVAVAEQSAPATPAAERPEYVAPEIVRGVVTIGRPRPERPAPVAEQPAAVARTRQPRTAAPARKPRRQKLATEQIAPGRYAFVYCGSQCEVTRGADGWVLVIDGRPGAKRYETKRHACNFARIYLESRTAEQPAALATAPVAVAAPVAAPAPAAPAADQPGEWRSLAPTARQVRYLARLRRKAAAAGIPYATPAQLTRGVASDLIDRLRDDIGAECADGESCCIGPFARGVCAVCGKRRAAGA